MIKNFKTLNKLYYGQEHNYHDYFLNSHDIFNRVMLIYNIGSSRVVNVGSIPSTNQFINGLSW